jgi:phosphoribosyl-AMP cyclohydrolase
MNADETTSFTPKFNEAGLVTCVTLDLRSKEVLMVAYMNAAALEETLRTRRAVYFSRSRQRLWRKGEESGNWQEVHEVRVDCDQDCLLLYVRQMGEAACHTGRRSCFYRQVSLDTPEELTVIDDERHFDPQKVYGAK